MNLKHKLMGSGLTLMVVAVVGSTQLVAADSIDDVGLDLLGISEAEYDAAVGEAAVAYNDELVAMGWISAEEAAEESEDGDWARVGRGQYYSGILDKDVFIADSLGVSLAELEAAEEASYDAKIAERVESGRLTEAEAADAQVIHDFEESIDEDSVLAQALGISVAELNEARANNVTYDDLLDELDLTDDEVDAAEDAILAQLVEDAVADGTLTAEQGEEVLDDHDGHGHGGRRGRGHGRDNDDAPDSAETEEETLETDNA